MADLIISKNIGTDEESGLDKRIDITKLIIDVKNKFVEVYYDINLIGKTGKIVTTIETDKTYIRRNEPAVMESRQKVGEPRGVMEDVEIEPAKPRFDQLAESEVGSLIKGMLENDLKNYPNIS